MKLALTVVLVAGGCALAAGPFGGAGPAMSGGGGYATTTVGPSSPSNSGQPKVGAFICANCGYGVGTAPGYGLTSVTRNGRTLEITDVNLRVWFEWVFRFHPKVNISLASAFELDTLQEPDGLTGMPKDVDYNAFAPTVNYNIMLGPKSRMWFGGGYMVGGVGGTSTNGFKAVAGIQRQIAHYVILRFEGSLGRGANDFEQEWINGGFVLWYN
jgi:hypothetical protein